MKTFFRLMVTWCALVSSLVFVPAQSSVYFTMSGVTNYFYVDGDSVWFTMSGVTNRVFGIQTNYPAYSTNILLPGSLGDVLTYDGTDWTAAAPAAAGVTDVSAVAPVLSSGGTTPAISIGGNLTNWSKIETNYVPVWAASATNANTAAAGWPTQWPVASITNLPAYQPADSDLTNWSLLATNYVPIWAQTSTNLVTAPNLTNVVIRSSSGPALTVNTNALWVGTNNVGIGTATPGDMLHVKNGRLRIEDSSTPYLDFYIGSTLAHEIWCDTTLFRLQPLAVNGRIVLYSRDGAGTQLRTMDLTGGNVGIGTTAPGRKLSINAADGGFLEAIYNDADGSPTSVTYMTNDVNGYLGIWPSGGRVGIGKVPTVALDVQGDLKATFIYDLNNVRYFGAVGDGVTDDTTAFQNAINTKSNIIVPPGIYKVATLNISNNTTIVGIGKPTISLGPADGTVFSGPTTTNVTIQGLTIYGGSMADYTGTSGFGSRNAIISRAGLRVIDCEITGFNCYAIYANQTTSATYPAIRSMLVSGCNISSNWTGIYILDDYIRIINCEIKRCREAIAINRGNANIESCSVLYNYYGLRKVGYSSNDGHGNFVGGMLNHNTYPIWIDATLLGFNLSGNQIMGGGTWMITNCTGIMVQNSQCDPDNIYVSGGTNSGMNYIRDNWFNDNSVTVDLGYGGTNGSMTFERNGLFLPANVVSMATTNLLVTGSVTATNNFYVAVPATSHAAATVSPIGLFASLNQKNASNTVAIVTEHYTNLFHYETVLTNSNGFIADAANYEWLTNTVAGYYDIAFSVSILGQPIKKLKCACLPTWSIQK